MKLYQILILFLAVQTIYSQCDPQQGTKQSFTQDDKLEVLRLLNSYRNFVAGGSEKLQPTATNMQILQWSEPLAQIAQTAAAQCRSDPLSGTDFVETAITQTGQIQYMATSAFNIFYSEKDNRFKGSYVLNYVPDDMYKNYAVLMTAKLNRVGCGIATINDTVNGTVNQILICRFQSVNSDGTLEKNLLNVAGSKVYNIGDPCSGCGNQSCGTVFPSLCGQPKKLDGTPDNYNPFPDPTKEPQPLKQSTKETDFPGRTVQTDPIRKVTPSWISTTTTKLVYTHHLTENFDTIDTILDNVVQTDVPQYARASIKEVAGTSPGKETIIFPIMNINSGNARNVYQTYRFTTQVVQSTKVEPNLNKEPTSEAKAQFISDPALQFKDPQTLAIMQIVYADKSSVSITSSYQKFYGPYLDPTLIAKFEEPEVYHRRNLREEEFDLEVESANIIIAQFLMMAFCIFAI